MNKRTYDQLRSLHKKGMAIEAVIEAIQSISLGRTEATPWLAMFCEDYAKDKIYEELKTRGLFKVGSND